VREQEEQLLERHRKEMDTVVMELQGRSEQAVGEERKNPSGTGA